MGSFNDERSMAGIQHCDIEKMQCRYCKFAEKEHIGRGYCIKYPESVRKPTDVYFKNAKCPQFEEGEDLLPYEIQI